MKTKNSFINRLKNITLPVFLFISLFFIGSDLNITENDVSVILSGYATSDLTGDNCTGVSDLYIEENNSSLSILKIVP